MGKMETEMNQICLTIKFLWCTILRQTRCISRQTQTNPTHPTNSWHLTSGLLTTFFILRPERVGIHHCLWTKNENSQFRLCFCPHTQAAQINIKSSCLFLVISVTSSYSLFYPGSLSTSSGPSIWPFLPVASHYMASFVSEAIHPTTGAALTAQGSLRTAETRSPASFPRRHFCPARPRHNKRQFMMFRGWARLRWCLFCSSGPTYFNDSSDRSDSLSTKKNIKSPQRSHLLMDCSCLLMDC